MNEPLPPPKSHTPWLLLGGCLVFGLLGGCAFFGLLGLGLLAGAVPEPDAGVAGPGEAEPSWRAESPPAASGSLFAEPSGLAGLYIGSKRVSMPGYRGGSLVRQLLLLGDGTARDGVPNEGLVALDQDRAANPSAWGRWSAQGGRSFQVDLQGRTSAYTPLDQLWACDDGFNVLRYGPRGARTLASLYEADVASPWWSEKSLRLAGDGTFEDRGLAAAVGTWLVGGGDEARARFTPGTGTYLLLDYTLVLRFGDGRAVAFSCWFEEADQGADPAHLTIRGCNATRR